jgi:hypothetical protein
MAEAATFTSEKYSSAVLEARHISFLCMVFVVKPFAPFSTMKQVNSGPSLSPPLTDCTMMPSVISVEPLVMKIFEPLMVHEPSPFSTALVLEPRESEPAPASVSPKANSPWPAASRGRYFFFCSSLPK